MDWQRYRAEFPVTRHLVHLNHAGVAPASTRVARAVTDFVQEAVAFDPSRESVWNERSERVRARFAALVGAQPDEIAFVKNTSEGLSLVAAGLDWRASDNVIAPDGEYPSNVYPWLGLRRWGVETRLVKPAGAAITVDDVRAAADARTRLVAVSFVDWQTGARTDLAPLGAWCRERGILFVVDGIQGAGALTLDVEKENVDVLAVGGHKWLLSLEGVGCLFLSRRVIGRVSSVLHGWKSVRDADTYLPYHFEPRRDAAKLEPGSSPWLGIHALGAALEMLLEVGAARIQARIFELTDRLAHGLRARGARIISPWGDGERSGIVNFRLGEDHDALRDALLARGFFIRLRAGGIRVAPHFYNDEEDIDRLLRALDELRMKRGA
jgi:selenocysteine lyase/cysteine desulfurase